jgi:hypothetical protein
LLEAGEILENLKLGCISSKGSSDTYIYTDTIDIDNIPDTLTNAQAPAISGIALETAVKDYYEIDSIIERLSKKINASLLRAIAKTW